MSQTNETASWSVAPETRERVIRATIEAFDTYGLAKVRVEDIARLAGVSRPTVYRTFPDRESLTIEVLVHFARRLNAQIHASIPPDASLETALTGIMRQTVESFLATPHNRELLGNSGQDQLSRYARTSERLQSALADRWAPYLAAARERGELPADIDVGEAVRWLSILNAAMASHVQQFEQDFSQLEHYYKRFALPAFRTGCTPSA